MALYSIMVSEFGTLRLLFLYNFICFWLCWVSFASRLFSSCGKWGRLSACSAQASGCGGFSRCGGAQAPAHVAFSSCSSRDLDDMLNHRGAWVWLLHGTWDPPRSEIEPVSPALAGGSFTSKPPGKPWDCLGVTGLTLTRSEKWGTLPQGCITVYWLFLSCLCIPSLPWLAAVSYVPLGTQGRSWRLKAILHNRETGDRKTSVLGIPWDAPWFH